MRLLPDAASRGLRPLFRVLVVWLSTAGALVLMAGVLSGFVVQDWWAALLGAAMLGLVNALVWPLVIRLALPLTVLTLGLFPLLLNGVIVVALDDYVLPGLDVRDLGTGIVVSFGVTVVTVVVTGLLAIDDDEVYQRRVLRRAARGVDPAGTTEVPGVVFCQIDGLGHDALKRALRDGNAPTLASWLTSGSHRLLGWETDWSSQTGASQAGILLGSNRDMPAFRWLEKESGRLMVSNHRSCAAEIEQRLSTGQGLLHADGASRNNIFTGDADHAILTMSVVGRRKGSVGEGYYTYFSRPYNTTRTLLVAAVEVFREWAQAAAQRRRDVRPRVPRGGLYPLLRTFTTVISRDVTVATVIGDVYAGRSVVYADFLGYDEVAHHSGVERYDALEALRRIDRELGRIARAAASAPRPYRIVVLSDHGQSQGATFRTRYGETLGDVVRTAMGTHADIADRTGERPAGEESWGYAAGAVEEAAAGPGLLARTARRVARRRRTPSGEVLLGPDRAEASAPAADEAVVLGSGNLGLVYLTREKDRVTLERIERLYPHLLPTLVDHPGVGFVLVRSIRHGPLVLGRDGLHALATGEVHGEDPLAPFGPSAPAQVLRTDGFPHCADLMVNSLWDAQTDEVAAFEELVGSHGGLGGEQTRPFVLHPVDLSAPGEPVHGAEQVHLLFRGWLADLGQGAYAEVPRPRAGEGIAGSGDTRDAGDKGDTGATGDGGARPGLTRRG
ncbi:MAG: phage holin family protein [Actinomycetes bacterium]